MIASGFVSWALVSDVLVVSRKPALRFDSSVWSNFPGIKGVVSKDDVDRKESKKRGVS